LSVSVAQWTISRSDSADFLQMGRQLLLWVAVLLLIAVVASAIAPVREQPSAPVFPAPTPPGAPSARTVAATLPSNAPVTSDVGDIVRLRVESEEPNRVLVSGLGVSAPVGPGSEGVVELVTDQPGRWTVRLDPSGTPIGVLEVSG
jgi:hypothetical protein